MAQDVFKFDVRVRDRLRRRGAVSQEEVEKHLKALSDVGGQAHHVDIADPTSLGGAGRSNGAADGEDDE